VRLVRRLGVAASDDRAVTHQYAADRRIILG
jgi:hypothetical protein